MLEFAKTPPKGWNSWDVYGASVTEEEVKRNADIMAEKLIQNCCLTATTESCL